jgi:hypothetical protein
MADQGTVAWNGASGQQYTYWIYALPAGINTGQDGNYIYTKVVNNTWVPIYIGQGDLGDRTNIDQHHQSRCLRSQGATHVHAHKNARETDRIAEERDLLAGHPNAYQPTGCNDKSGG